MPNYYWIKNNKDVLLFCIKLWPAFQYFSYSFHFQNNSFSPSSKFRNGYNFPNVESGEGVGQDNTAEFGVKRKSSDAGVNEYGIEIAKDESQAKQNKISLVAEPEKLPKRGKWNIESKV